jgi:peptidoglycan/xylan/chitin deacetylase (PgdA/CDA1 family)
VSTTPKPSLTIIPWNGYKAAISLSFDDGDPSQLETAVPELSKRGIRGTFFLIANRLKNLEEWKKAAQAGQEIGNHTLDHRHGRDLNATEAVEQVQLSRQKLEESLGVSSPTFAYPFTEITADLRRASQNCHFLSRGGYGAVCMNPENQPDWHYLASQVAYAHTSSGILKGWTDQNIYGGTWSIPQFHAFTGSQTGWQPLSPVKFSDFLDDLVERKKEIWVAPLGEVGAYWQAQGILEKANIERKEETVFLRWKKPLLIPAGTILKVRLAKNTEKVYQKNQLLEPSAEGIYQIAFDAEELQLTLKS